MVRCWLAVVAGLALCCAARAAEIDCYGAVVEVGLRASGGGALSVPAVYGYPAAFGPPLNGTGAWRPLAAAQPADACEGLQAAAVPGAVALALRGNCSFAHKAAAAQAAGFGALLLYDAATEGCIVMGGNASEAPQLATPAASISQQAGELLGAAVRAGGVEVALAQPPLNAAWDQLAELLLWAMAVSTLVAGSLWAGWDFVGRPASAEEEALGAVGAEHLTITTRGAVGFAFVASGLLLLLFFLLSRWLAAVLTVLFALACWQGAAVAVAAALAAAAPALRRVALTLPGIGKTRLLDALASGSAAVLVGVWLALATAPWAWMLQDLLSACLMVLVLRQLLLPNLKVASVLLPLMFCYDVWWVFLQPWVTGGPSVMVEVAVGDAARSVRLPMLLRVPQSSLGSNPAYSVLGLGDVVVPGLLAAFTRRYDLARAAGSGWRALARGYFLPCTLGYGVGLGLTYAALLLQLGGSQGQPALLYLVPCTLGTVAALAHVRSDLRDMWGCSLAGGGGARRRPEPAAEALLSEDGEP